MKQENKLFLVKVFLVADSGSQIYLIRAKNKMIALAIIKRKPFTHLITIKNIEIVLFNKNISLIDKYDNPNYEG